MKKNLAVLGLLVVLLISCGEQAPQQEVLTVIGEDSSNLNAIESVLPRYNKLPRLKIKIDKSSFELSYEKSLQDLVNGSGLYDIHMQYNFSLSSFIENNWVFTLPELEAGLSAEAKQVQQIVERDLFENAWREVGYYSQEDSPRSVPVGYPFASNTMLLVYNKGMFYDPSAREDFAQRYGRGLSPPETWKEFYQVAEFFTDETQGTKGIAMHGAAGGWLYYEWAAYVFGMGGKVMDKTTGWEGNARTPLLLTDRATVEATKFFLSMKAFNKGDFYSTGGTEQRELLARGDVAMGLIWSDYIHPLVMRHPDKFGFIPIPGGTSGLAGGAFFVNRNSKKPEEALDFILFLLQPEIQKEMMKEGLCSPLKSVYQDSEVLEAVPYAAALGESLARGVYFWEAGPDAEAIQQIVTEWVQRMWRGDVTVEEGLREAQGEIQIARATIFAAIDD